MSNPEMRPPASEEAIDWKAPSIDTSASNEEGPHGPEIEYAGLQQAWYRYMNQLRPKAELLYSLDVKRYEIERNGQSVPEELEAQAATLRQEVESETKQIQELKQARTEFLAQHPEIARVIEEKQRKIEERLDILMFEIGYLKYPTIRPPKLQGNHDPARGSLTGDFGRIMSGVTDDASKQNRLHTLSYQQMMLMEDPEYRARQLEGYLTHPARLAEEEAERGLGKIS